MLFSRSWIEGFLSEIDSYNRKYRIILQDYSEKKKKAKEERDKRLSILYSSMKADSLDIRSLEQLVEKKRKQQDELINAYYKELQYLEKSKDSQIIEIEQHVIDLYPPHELEVDLFTVWSQEPNYDNYHCPSSDAEKGFVRIGDYVANIDDIFNSNTIPILNKYYSFLLHNERYIRIPCILSLFEGEMNLLFPYETNEDALNHVLTLVIRLFTTMSPGNIQFTFFDPIGLAQAFSVLVPFVDQNEYTKRLIGGSIWTTSEDIHRQLEIIQDHIKHIHQDALKGVYASLQSYNLNSVERQPYRILVIKDFPSQFSEQDLIALKQIISGGSSCGVHVVIIPSNKELDLLEDETIKSLATDIINSSSFRTISHDCYFNNNAISNIHYKNQFHFVLYICPFDPKYIPINLRNELCKSTGHSYSLAKLNALVKKQSLIRQIDKSYLNIPIGVSGGTTVQSILLGKDAIQHVLILGNIRIGKSNLIRTIILESISQYSPKNVEIYLIDQSGGTTFSSYAKIPHPSIRAIALKNDPEFSIYILKLVYRAYQQRQDMFTDVGAETIENYNKIRDDAPLPHILLCIDDFTCLLNNPQIKDEAIKILVDLIKIAGKYGIHIILSSQNYQGMGLENAYQNMAVRIVFECDSKESSALLSDPKRAHEFTHDDQGKAILNSYNGQRNYNILISVPELARDQMDDIRILKQSKEQIANGFDSSCYPTLVLSPDIRFLVSHPFNTLSANSIDKQYQLGHSLDVDSKLCIDLFHNLLIVGGSRSLREAMLLFSILSVCFQYRAEFGQEPSCPIAYLICDSINTLSSQVRTLIQLLSDKYIQVLDNKENISDFLRYYTLTASHVFKKTLFIFDYSSITTIKKYISPNLMPDSFAKNENTVSVVLVNSSIVEINEKELSWYDHKIGIGLREGEAKAFGCQDAITNSICIYSERTNDYCQFRSFVLPDETWIKKICRYLNMEE